jgi:hypothetical protein
MSEPRPLRAGPWSLTLDDGDLRDLRVDGVCVVQRIYAAVRDGTWRTIPGTVQDLRVEAGADRFRVAFRRLHRLDGIAYDAEVVIDGEPDGRITFAFSGIARSAFQRNRIGICVLHDGGLAGAPVRVEHGDGRSDEARFPGLISPHQPFFDVAALTVRPRPGREATVRFAGEVFETEDQRNWGDASFKTYSTPQSRPKPVAVAVGDTVEQRVELSLSGHGLALAAEWDPAADPGLLAAWGVSRLRAVLAPGADPAPLRAAHLPLDLILQGPPESWPGLEGLRLASVVAVPLDRTTPTAWVQRLHELLPDIPVGGGHVRQFTEFNRGRPDGSGWGVVDVPVDPWVHGEEASSLLANVPGLAAIAASAQAIMPGAAIHLALAHGRRPHLAGRHRGDLGGRWLQRAIATAAAAGVATLSLGPAAWLSPPPSPA